MAELLNYPAMVKTIRAERGCSEPEAIKIMHTEFCGARRAWNNATPEQRQAAVVVPISAANSGTSGGAAAAEPELDYQPIDREGIRRSLNRGKPKSETAAAEPNASTSQGDQDYFGLIAAERQRSGCDFPTAAARVNRQHPHAWRSMLEKANPGRDLSQKFNR